MLSVQKAVIVWRKQEVLYPKTLSHPYLETQVKIRVSVSVDLLASFLASPMLICFQCSVTELTFVVVYFLSASQSAVLMVQNLSQILVTGIATPENVMRVIPIAMCYITFHIFAWFLAYDIWDVLIKSQTWLFKDFAAGKGFSVLSDLWVICLFCMKCACIDTNQFRNFLVIWLCREIEFVLLLYKHNTTMV